MRLPFEVMVLVRRGAEVLVLHRAPTYEAYWHLVAGAQEPGESAAQAAQRELLEEIGLDAPVVDVERPFAYALADEPESVRSRFAPDVEQVTVTCFVAEAPPGWEPALNDEHDTYRWCSREEAAELLFWPEPRELVLAL